MTEIYIQCMVTVEFVSWTKPRFKTWQ